MNDFLRQDHDEAVRLARLRELLVLDSEPEPLFDHITRLASQVCNVPVALISLVDEERQWFKSNVGLPGVHETPRELAFCAHTIRDDAIFEVPDATADPRFADNALVTGAPDIRFYTGAPLVLEDGARVGSLCVIDRQARQLDAGQLAMLTSLAAMASAALTMRRDLINASLSVRTRYEQELAESEQRYRVMVEQQTEMVWLVRADGSVQYVNPSSTRMVGRGQQDLLDTALLDHIDPVDREAVRLVAAKVLAEGSAQAGEYRMLGANGLVHWVSWTFRRQIDAQQPVLHCVGRDIGERKRAELALRASEEFLRRTGHAAGVGGWQLELASNTVTWSDETRRIHQVELDYVPTLESAIAFYAPEARPVIEAAVQRSLQGGESWDLELPLITAAGRSIWVRAVGEVEFVREQPVRLVGAFQDITDRKQLQQRLADSERFVRLITDRLPVQVAYLDLERRYRFMNLSQSASLGMRREQMLGRSRAELFGQKALDTPFDARLDAAFAGSAAQFECDQPVDGLPRRMETSLVPDLDEQGAVRGVIVTGVDITERSAAERSLRVLATIFENTSDYVAQTDWRGKVSYMNPAVRRAVGMNLDEPVSGRSFADFNTEATSRRFVETIVPRVRAEGIWVGESTVYLANRREVPVSHMVIGHRDADGRVERYSAVMRDISVEVEAKQALERQSATLRSITEAIPAIIAVVGTDRRFRFVNSGFERWIGAPRASIVGRTIAEVQGGDDAEFAARWVDRALAGETVSFEREYPPGSHTRNLALSYIPLRLDSGVVDGFVSVGQDITQHRREESRLLELAQRDPLTGLLNRAGFEQVMEHWLAQGGGPSLALLYVDLDHFKPVNDQHGHPVGDRVLQMFSQRLRGLVRPTDAVARLGGDEFAVLLSGVRESANAQLVADKVIRAAQAPFYVDDLQLTIGTSVGVAFGADPYIGWRDLVARADVKLYEAKQAGRGRQAG